MKKQNHKNNDPNQAIEIQTKKTFTEAYELMMKRGGSFLCSLDVLEDPTLSASSKVLFQLVSSLSYNEGYCYASNNYLAKKMDMSISSIKVYLKQLQTEGLIGHDNYRGPRGFNRNIHIQFNYLKIRYMKARENRQNADNQ